MLSSDSSRILAARPTPEGTRECLVRKPRLKNLLSEVSDSSIGELVGVSGGVGGGEACSRTLTCRTKETEIVVSAAISFASSENCGFVANTTKYGIYEARENVTEAGKVISKGDKSSSEVYLRMKQTHCAPEGNRPVGSKRHL